MVGVLFDFVRGMHVVGDRLKSISHLKIEKRVLKEAGDCSDE